MVDITCTPHPLNRSTAQGMSCSAQMPACSALHIDLFMTAMCCSECAKPAHIGSHVIGLEASP